MNITKRITKFLLIAALAIPAWTTASAQNRTAPPEMAPTENQVREKAKDLKGLSVATRNSESRPVGKSVSINASNAIKLSTPISKVKVSTAPDGPKVKGVKPVNAVNSDAKTGQPSRTSAPQLKAPELRTDVPDGYALIVFVVGDVWGDGTGYQMLLDKDATMYDSWYSASNSGSIGKIQSQDIYNIADYTIPENADYVASGNAENFLVNQTGQVVVPAGTYDILIANPTPGSGIWLASANGNIGGRINDYAIAAGNVYTFTVSLGGTNDQTDVEITSVADMLETPTNLVADPGVTSANISWEAGMNNESWNLRYRPYVDKTLINRLWDLSVDNYLEQLDEGWFVVDNDNDSKNWDLAYNSNAENDLCFYSFSYDNGTSYDPDNWLISPAIGLGGTLKFKLWNRNSNYKDKVAVYLYIGNLDLNSNLSINDFVKISDDYAPETSPTEYTLSLSSYSGVGHLLFRHYNSYDKYSIYLDDIEVTVPNPVELPEWTYVNDVTNPYTITGLTNNTTYEVQVQGVGNNTTTDWTNSVVFTTLESIDPTTELDFGSVDVESSKTLSAYIANDSDSPVTATITVAPNPPFSVAETTVTLAANTLTSIPVTFTPDAAIGYTGTLTVSVNGENTVVALRGAGHTDGPGAIRDESFFEGITYTWTNDEGTHTSNLSEIATDPDQIIAMLKEVYVNRNIPGNYKRGYTTSGTSDHDDNVMYTGVGRINSSGQYENTYGWNIPGNVLSSTGSTSYKYMQEDQYKPYDEGVTLLLLEIVDDFDATKVDTNGDPTHDYAGLKAYFKKAIKSARVVTKATRVGKNSDFSSGTLFKIDCNKMNKFYLIAKGQLAWLKQRENNSNSSSATTYSFYGYPMYYGGTYLDYGLHGNYLNVEPAFLCHMFEQLSPAEGNSSAPLTDGYQMFVTEMKSFGIIHDCPNVPYVLGTGHHFMMYGQDSPSEDCQDIRDMMLLVPDYRMMNWTGRGSTSSTSTSTDGRRQDYFYYHQSHQPKIGVFVIHQNPITGDQIENQETYKLHLTWKSNLLDFLPEKAGQYDLYRVITNADGTKTYQLVGEFDPNTFEYYDDVPMQKNGQQVTYVVQGQDIDGFLSLQMSNEESFIIPGLDRAEQLRIDLNSDYYFSRYDAAEQKNYYSNSLIANNTVGTNVKPAYLENGSQFKFWRATLKTVDGEAVVDTEHAVNFVTAEVGNYTQTGGGKLTYGSWVDQTPFGDKPYGHGYHANPTTSDITIVNGEVKFAGLKLYDNFCVDVSENAHPAQYVYYVTLETAVPFDLNVQGTETSTHARSNTVNVPVYKAEMVMKPITAAQVEADVDHKAPAATKFELDARYSSKSEILGYYIYRWADKAGASARTIYDSEGEDASPQGQAGNQGEYYTVAMNTDYTAETEHFASDFADVTATFLDNFMNNEATEADTYTYAPVVELFAPAQAVVIPSGEDRDDYNTYGGPQQMTAGGLITIKPGTPVATADEFTPQTTTGTTDKCKYYYIPVTINVDLPEGYEIYKVRAWRQIDKQWLGEEESQYFDRVSDDYLFETLGDEANNVNDVLIGEGSVDGNAHHHKGLFGAKSLASDESFDANFIVRVYFTKPSKDGEARYYIAEKQQIVNVNSENIITGVVNVKGNKQVAGVKYYNLAGIESDQPFDGVNMVVTRYTDGSTSTSKVIK